jgi:hypothetical protein
MDGGETLKYACNSASAGARPWISILALLGREAPLAVTYHSTLAPVAMQPGTSNEYAENPRWPPRIPHLSRSIGGEYQH